MSLSEYDDAFKCSICDDTFFVDDEAERAHNTECGFPICQNCADHEAEDE